MAGPNSETSALWEVQSSAGSGSQATATDTHTVWFNAPDTTIGDTQYSNHIEVDFRRAVPENESVNADNNELQDMGIGGLDLIITASIKNANNDTSTNGLNKLVKWLKDGNTTTGYTKGRFGLSLASIPQFDVTPTSTYGYHLRDVKFIREGENHDRVIVIITLALGGDIANAI